MRYSLTSLVMTFVIGFVLTPSASVAQSSLADQQRKCDALRADVADARRKLKAQESRADAAARTDDKITNTMRAKGQSEAMIRQYQSTMDMQRNWSGNARDARRDHEEAREAYELQGCSTEGRSNYNYEVE